MELSASRASTASTASTIGSRARRASMETVETMDTAQSIAPTEAGEELEPTAEPSWPIWQLPSRNPATAPWNVKISGDDFDCMLEGFESNHYNDRWDIKAVPREGSSNMTLVHFARYMAETPDYSIVIRAGHDDDSGEEEITIISIIWETIETLLSPTGDRISEDYAKREVVFLARQFLVCELPGLEEVQYDEWWPKWAAWKNRILASISDDDDDDE